MTRTKRPVCRPPLSLASAFFLSLFRSFLLPLWPSSGAWSGEATGLAAVYVALLGTEPAPGAGSPAAAAEAPAETVTGVRCP